MINSKEIKKRMIDKNLNVSEVSKLINVNINTVSRWLNNKNLNQIENFLKLLEILELEIKDIKKNS